ncbi:MAG TPA: VOC family protein [Aldersonia sp.]
MIRTYPEGVTSWIDLEQGDVEAAKSFYGELFGWQFSDATPPTAPFRYVIARLDDQDVAGLGGPADPTATDPDAHSWATYVAVDDATAAAQRVREAGGSVVVEPTAAGEGGVSVVCADPASVEFRLWQAKNRPGAQLTNSPGTWNFSDLYTTDLDAARAFYSAVFGWGFVDLGFAHMITRHGYGDHLAATVDPGIHERQAGIDAPPGFADAIGWLNALPAGETPRWHVTFTVANRDETAALAKQLGGRVVSTTDTEWTREALIADPAGAVFSASQFSPEGVEQ